MAAPWYHYDGMQAYARRAARRSASLFRHRLVLRVVLFICFLFRDNMTVVRSETTMESALCNGDPCAATQH